MRDEDGRRGTICTHKEKLSLRHALNKFSLVINKEGRIYVYLFTRISENIVPCLCTQFS